jgi:hypothetical protein
MFGISLVGFAAIRDDGYSHATKAVSELGSTDAANALAFNLLGFITPGVLLILFSLALLQDARSRLGPGLLLGSGFMLALAGLAPANLEDYGALTPQLHALGAIGSGVLWVLALFWLGPMLRRDFGLSLGAASPLGSPRSYWPMLDGRSPSGRPDWSCPVGGKGSAFWDTSHGSRSPGCCSGERPRNPGQSEP